MQRIEGDALAVRKAAADADLSSIDLGHELGHEPGFSRTSGTEHGHERRRPLGADAPEGIPKHAQLAIAADERRAQAFDATMLLGDRAHERARRERLDASDTLRLDLARRVVADTAARDPVGQRADEDLAGPGGLLETRAQVHDRSGHKELGAVPGPRDGLARVHADAYFERNAFAPQARDALAKRERRTHRAVGIVVVCGGHAEDRHHRVADELLDRSAMRLEDRSSGLERPRESLADDLGIVFHPERGRAHDVSEEDGDELPFFGHAGSLWSTH